MPISLCKGKVNTPIVDRTCIAHFNTHDEELVYIEVSGTRFHIPPSELDQRYWLVAADRLAHD